MALYRRHRVFLRNVALCSIPILAACTQNGAYVAPSFPFFQSYKAEKSGVPVLLSNAEWWRGLNEPVLNELVDLALRDNLSLTLSRERVVQARAEAHMISPLFGFTPSASAYATRDDDLGKGIVGSGSAALGFSWMLDPWGGKSAERKAAAARIDIAGAEVDAGQLLVLYNLANAYVDLRYRQQLIILQEQDLAGRQRILRLTRDMQQSDAATKLEITRSKARVAEIQAQLPGLKADEAMKRNEIAVLVGFAPGELPVNLAFNNRQPAAKMAANIGIPADLLRNRPDLRLAERSYYAAVQDIGVAQAARYPQVSLMGAISLNTLSSGGDTVESYFGPSLKFPDLASSAPQATVSARESAARQAYTSWKDAVLQAILEVENALIDYNGAAESLAASHRAVRLFGEARDMMDEVFRGGNTTLSELIDADQEVTAAKKALALAQYRKTLSFVALNVGLGSGHSAGQKLAAR